MHIVIVGCGRVGAELAGGLAADGHTTAVVDTDPTAFARLGNETRPARHVGAGFDQVVLMQAGIQRADALAAVTGTDSTNILAAMIARQVFAVPRVVARVHDPVYTASYRRLGITTVSPTTLCAQAVREMVSVGEATARLRFGSGEVELVEFEAPHRLAGHTIAEFTGPGQMGVAAIVRHGRAFVPPPGAQIEAGDLLYVAVDAAFTTKLRAMIQH